MEKDWLAIPAITVPFTANAVSLGGALEPGVSATVLRMLVGYIVRIAAAPSAGDAARVGIGIGVVSADAFAAGSGSVPEPLGDPAFPWLYWAEHTLAFPTTSLDPASDVSSVRQLADIRSMRKMKAGQSLAMILQYAAVAGSPDLTFHMSQTRVLFGGL